MLNNSLLYGYILAPSSRYTFKNEVDGEFIYGPGLSLSLFKTPNVSYYHMYQQISLLCHAEAISPAFHDPNLTDGHTAHRQLLPTRAGVGTRPSR